MFNIRPLTEEDYQMLCEWWKINRFPAPPQDCLPNNGKGGIMVSKNGIDICAGFLYYTNSKLAWLEFIVANFHYREKDRGEALQFLIDELSGIAERKGFKAVFASIKKESLINHYEACGFSKNEGTVEMVRKL